MIILAFTHHNEIRGFLHYLKKRNIKVTLKYFPKDRICFTEPIGHVFIHLEKGTIHFRYEKDLITKAYNIRRKDYDYYLSEIRLAALLKFKI